MPDSDDTYDVLMAKHVPPGGNLLDTLKIRNGFDPRVDLLDQIKARQVARAQKRAEVRNAF